MHGAAAKPQCDHASPDHFDPPKLREPSGFDPNAGWVFPERAIVAFAAALRKRATTGPQSRDTGRGGLFA